MNSGFERLFGLDVQLLFDVLIEFIMLMFLYVCISKLYFRPARRFLLERQKRVDAKRSSADAETKEALRLKKIYEARVMQAEKEGEDYLSKSRKSALEKQKEIMERTREKAAVIIDTAEEEILKEKAVVRESVKKEMTRIAALMAGRYVDVPDSFRQALLLEETLKEMGNKTWQS